MHLQFWPSALSVITQPESYELHTLYSLQLEDPLLTCMSDLHPWHTSSNRFALFNTYKIFHLSPVNERKIFNLSHRCATRGAASLSEWFSTFRGNLMASYSRAQMAKKFRHFGTWRWDLYVDRNAGICLPVTWWTSLKTGDYSGHCSQQTSVLPTLLLVSLRMVLLERPEACVL